MTSKITLSIKGMHCGSCAYLIEDILKEQKGVTEAKVDFVKQTCEVETAEEVKPDDLIKAIHEIQGEEFAAQIID
ncbi:MAG TPA: heavy metal-associated domain-containing protein [Patescibacteria group bacterium]|nr:heavy metal-associated domain-containing protein [Patescibacteria group bacterium]